MGYSKKSIQYHAYTLIEMLVVMSILIIFMGMSFSAFGGLQNTIKMNEYVLTLEQNITNVQRAAMLLERTSTENWIYGLGIDFSNVTVNGAYKTFKWCSPFEDYGDITTKSYIPGFNPAYAIETSLYFGKNGYIVLPTGATYQSSLCNDLGKSSLVGLPGYETSLTPPAGSITLSTSGGKEIRYILFESVSGRAFFYNSDGKVVNYTANGEPLSSNLVDFSLTINPNYGGATKQLTVGNLSGRVKTKNL